MKVIQRIPPIAVCLVVALVLASCRRQETPRETPPDTPDTADTASAPGPAVPSPVAPAAGWTAVVPADGQRWAPLPLSGAVAWDPANGILRLGNCDDLTGVRWTGPAPVVPFEVELEARRIEGSDIFCALTFPARGKDQCVSLVVGGWGGQLVGISSLDGMDASENESSSQREFETGRWYRIRLRAEPARLQAWIDDEAVVDVETANRRLSLRFGPIEDCAPFGLATWQTTGEFRALRWRPVPATDGK